MLIFDMELVAEREKVLNTHEAIWAAAESGLRLELFSKKYIQAACDREKVFPTGLMTSSSIGVALVHAFRTDSDTKDDAVLSLLRLTTPTRFYAMGSPQEVIDVSLVFFLYLGDNKDTGLINSLVRMFIDDNTMMRLVSNDIGQLLDTVKSSLMVEGISIRNISRKLDNR